MDQIQLVTFLMDMMCGMDMDQDMMCKCMRKRRRLPNHGGDMAMDECSKMMGMMDEMMGGMMGGGRRRLPNHGGDDMMGDTV